MKPQAAGWGLSSTREQDFVSIVNSNDSQTAVKSCLSLMKKSGDKEGEEPANALAEDKSHPAFRNDSQREDLSGILVDWLERLDPELSSVDLEQQMDVIFRWNKQLLRANTGTCGHTWQPYLLSSLTHNCSWKTFQRCADHLLRPQAVCRLGFRIQ